MSETIETQTEKTAEDFINTITDLMGRYGDLMEGHRWHTLSAWDSAAVSEITEQLKPLVKHVVVREDWHLTTERPNSYEYLVIINGYDFDEMELAISGTVHNEDPDDSVTGLGYLFYCDNEIRKNVVTQWRDRKAISAFVALVLREELN